ncbi:hypothetical protein FRC02_002131 [Tulasnella sp. 418]|nr:hypothetical protein FRC02_002131 [Tulasnella sp. 418]
MSDTEIDRVHQDTSMHSNPSSHSASRTPIFSQIGLMKKWSSKRRSKSNSQTNPPTAGLMEPPSRPMSPKTPEPQRPTSPRPLMFRAASTTPPSTSDNPPPVTSLKRRGSSSQRSQTSVKKNPISKVFGFSTSSNPPARNVPSGPSSGRQPASIGRSVSNPYTESLAPSSLAPSSLMERPSLLGLRTISGSSLRSKHKREESQESGSRLGAEYTTIPPLPPVPTSVQTDSGSQPPPSTERSSTSSRIPDLPPVLPEPALLPPIELSPPSPPRLVTSASQPLSKKSSPPGYSASLGKANGSNFVTGVSSGSMRRNMLEDLNIPARISKAQSGLRNNMVMVKEFAGNVEQLKTLQTAYQNLTCDIKRILESQSIPKKETVPRRSSNASSLPPGAAPPRSSDRYQLAGQEIVKIEEKYALWWECAELLIELGSTPLAKKGEDDPQPAVAEEPSDQPVTDNGPGQVLDIKNTSVGAEGERTPTIPPEPTSPPFTPGKARERAITLAGTESEKEAASAIGGLVLGPGSASTTNVSGKGPPPANRPKWRALTGRHDLNNRQLALLKDMLSNPNPSALFSPPANPKQKQLSMPHYQPSPIAEAPPSKFNGSSDALSPEPEPKGKETHPPISHHHFFHRRIHPATASAVTLPSSLSSASPHLPVTHMLPSTSDLTHTPSASPVPARKARRASRVALTGIRDILRS